MDTTRPGAHPPDLEALKAAGLNSDAHSRELLEAHAAHEALSLPADLLRELLAWQAPPRKAERRGGRRS